jgi:DNA-binding beta-propeller fold protein YncE
MILIDPAGFLLGVLRGEGRRQQLDQLIGAQITEAEKRGLLVDSALAVSPRSEPRSALRFPGKVLATANSLYIADSGRNRILHTYHDGTIRRVFGSGTAGLLDGPEMEAMFNNPQGMVIVGDFLYIADTGNHAIRRVHLKSGEVMTAAGTGEQGRYAADDYREPLQARLNSPWDLTYHESNLYIAMAGQHQIWRMNLNHLGIERYAGSGREDIVDGPRSQACFAQPSAVAAHNNDLYVLDAQASAVRSIWLNGTSVNSLAGAGLFDFGDRDGVGRDARLQHPLGLAVDPQRNSLWIADTFNSKIKRMDLRTRKLTSCNFSHALNEPHGVSLHGNRLFIANTNAHQVVAVDLQTQRTGVVDVREP